MDLTVRNANCERVAVVMDKLLKERYNSVCGGPRCINVIAAIALNYLPPHYHVDEDGGKELGSPWLMVETAVKEAMDRVRETPGGPPHQL